IQMSLTCIFTSWFSALPAVCLRSESVVKRPGESHKLTCSASGIYFSSWIRQREGKPMDWIFYQWGSGSFHQNDALKNKFSYSRDTSAGTVYLQMNSLKAEDSAVYYCARDAQ
uniref:Ig-like domain-containing protein n=1 Tax=Oryzias sinensis TaxID=183150 RepID=A0A8C7WVK1_9TELE